LGSVERSKLKHYDNDIGKAYTTISCKITAKFIKAITHCNWTLYT